MNGKPNGQGAMTMVSGEIYEGVWINGVFIKKVPSGVYQGTWKDGMFHGKGTMTYNDGTVYVGEWLNGIHEGFGKKVLNNYFYEGIYKNGYHNGYGKRRLEDGTFYKGMWKDHLYHGQGELTNPDGSSYDGLWDTGSFIQGTFTIMDGKICEGTWKDGKLPSLTMKNCTSNKNYRKYVWENGVYYIGEFQNDKRHGFGKIFYLNDTIFVGKWADGYQVKGKIIRRGRLIYDGFIQNGMRHIFGKRFHKDGTVYEGEWKNGKRHGRGQITRKKIVLADGWWKENVLHENITHPDL
jgi:hypothetical protein